MPGQNVSGFVATGSTSSPVSEVAFTIAIIGPTVPSLGLPGTSGDTAPLSDVTINECAAAGGSNVIGLQGCYFLGNYGESCTSVCQARDLQYSDLTRTEIGSGATHFVGPPGAEVETPACTATLEVLAAPLLKFCSDVPSLQLASSAFSSGSDTAVGCVVRDFKMGFPPFGPDHCVGAEFPGIFRTWISWQSISNVETTADANGLFGTAARACACE
ncbi:MAG: hypothetical protein AB8G18_01005 [Gammaproteobacteria bacterium]